MFKEDKVIIWDTEFTSWEGCHENGWDHEKGQYKEVIQIGAVLIDTETLEILDEFNKFVQPQINPELSEYIKDLTGITQEQVNNAEKFEHILEEFLKWSKGYNLYSYENDLSILNRNLELYELKVKIKETRFKDIRPIFKDENIPIDEWNSGNIAKYFNPDIELLSQHNALQDAKNMVKALELMKNQSSSTAS